MQTFFLFGKYNAGSVNSISAQRTQKAADVVKKLGGKILSSYALLGCHDLVFIVDLPDTAKAMKASIDLAKATGIGFTTSPAVTVEEFDKIVA
ncbi:MAG: GYD domain-containing protein [Candidatus Omnitrophica bacterium]|nr:GYD domain-containing protein [Candidatus Omnitrophota bacterium]